MRNTFKVKYIEQYELGVNLTPNIMRITCKIKYIDQYMITYPRG